MAIVAIPGGYLESAAASQWFAMLAAGMPTGGITSSYRDTSEQRRIFLSRYQPIKVAYAPGKYDRRKYLGVWWWRKPGRDAAAVPGTSLHEQGRAIDIDVDSATYAWIRKHGAKYGFVMDRVNAEPWHIEFHGVAAKPPPTPTPIEAIEEEEAMYTIVSFGDSTDVGLYNPRTDAYAKFLSVQDLERARAGLSVNEVTFITWGGFTAWRSSYASVLKG